MNASIDSRPPALVPVPAAAPQQGGAAANGPALDATPGTGFARYRYLVQSDLYRIDGRLGAGAFLARMLSADAFRYNFWLRSCEYTKSSRWLRYTLHPIAWAMHRRLTWKLGISIPASTRIGPGLYIGHFGGIIVNHNTVIGRNCNLSQGVTLGKANRGRNRGYPTIGDDVFIGPGAVVVGKVRIGNNVAIGANSVVTGDVPDNAVVVGVPGRVVSLAGADGYVNRTDYDDRIARSA